MVDQSQANAQLAQFGAEVPAKLAPAGAALNTTTKGVQDLGFALDATGENVAFAGSEIVEKMELSRHTIHEAKGEAALLGEALGIHLPRHVRSFIAEIPGVATALSAAFSATAIFFIIEALTQGIEKIIEFAHSAERIQKAWDEVHESEDKALHAMEDDLLRAMIKTDELTGNHLEALRLKLELIDRTSLGKLREEFKKLEDEADKAFVGMDRNWFAKLFANMEGSADAKKTFDEMSEAVNKAFATRQPEAFDQALGLVNKAVDTANAKLAEFVAQQKKMDEAFQAPAGKHVGNAVDPRTVQSWNELIERTKEYKAIIEDAQTADKLEKINQAIDRLKQQQSDLEAQAKRTLAARLAQIEETRVAELAAFTSGKIGAQQWSEAQIKSADDSAKANIAYKDSLALIAKKTEDTAATLRNGTIDAQKWADAQKDSSGASKALGAAQDVSNERLKQWASIAAKAGESLVKAQSQTAALRAEMEKLVFPAEKAKDQAQAFKELEAAERQLAEAQKQLALAQVSGDFKEQEAAIKQLSNLRIISKQREAALLTQLNQREERDALKILTDQLANQERILNAAKAKFQNASANPLDFTDAQLAQLKTKLDEAQIAWDKTQTQIIRQQSATNDRMLVLDKSFYNQVLALAIATGDKLLAARLKENHAQLLSAQAQLADAKARGADTKAIEAQIKALQKHESVLLKDAAAALRMGTAGGALLKSKPSWDAFFTDLVSGSLRAGEAVKELGQMTAEGIGASVAAAVSGSSSFGAAMQKMAKDAIAALAEHAVVKSLEELAYGFSALANPFTASLAPGHFIAAAKWAAVGGAAAAVGSAIGGGGGGSSKSASSGGSAGPAANSPNVNSQQPSQVVNVTHLSGGGLATRPTFAVIGDSASGGSAREAVLPLDNNSAMKQIAQAIAAQMKGGSTPVEIHFHGGIGELVSRINKGAQDGTIRVYATHSRNGTALSK